MNQTLLPSSRLAADAVFTPGPLRAGLLLGLLLLSGAASAQAPNITGLSPRRNAVSAPRTTPVAVTFDQPLDNTPATQQALKVFSQQSGGNKAGTATVSGNTLTFSPTSSFKAGETVLATVTSAVQSSGGQNLARPQVFQFTAATAPSQGVFHAGFELPLGLGISEVAVADVDGDGDLDILALNSSTSTVSVRLNNGDNTFSTGQPVLLGSSSIEPSDLTVGDLDGDGDLDFLVVKSWLFSSVSVRLNNGDGTFSNGPELGNSAGGIGPNARSAVLRDMNGDGTLDLLLVTSQVGRDGGASVFLNSGSASFSASNGGGGGGLDPSGLRVGDVDNDGDQDFLISGFSRFLNAPATTVYLNSGTGTFSSGQRLTSLGSSYQLADLDGDGDLDLLTSDGLLLNDGTGTFSNSSQVSVENGVVGDVDGDGDLDLLNLTAGGTIITRLNDGQGQFTASQVAGSAPSIGPLFDLDGDGTLDIVSTDRNTGIVSVRLNRAAAVTASSYRLNAGGGALTTSRGLFAADQYFSNASRPFATTAPIAGTTDPALYQTERYSVDGVLRYALPVANGQYTVVLHFAEIYWTQVGQRVFDINLEGTTVLDNFDIFRKVGSNTATTETFTATVTDGVLNIDLSALAADGGVDQAKLSALEVIPAPVAAYRLNAGGGALTTSRGLFAADQYFSNASRPFATTTPIAGTTDPALYQTERHSVNGVLNYALPLANGQYTVVLHFAEIYWTQVGQRVFDINLEGTKVRGNYDIVSKVGPNTATTETFAVTVADGVLNLDLSVPYLSGGVDQAKLSALEVLSVGVSGSRQLAGSSALATKTSAPLSALSVYPNPSQGSFTLLYTSAKMQQATLTLTDRLGRVVQEQIVPLQAGPNQVPVRAVNLTQGLYQLTLRPKDGQRQSQKVMIQP